MAAALLFSLAIAAAPAEAGEVPFERDYELGTLVESTPPQRGPVLGLVRSDLGSGGVLSFEDEGARGRLVLSAALLKRFLLQDLEAAGLAAPQPFEIRRGKLRVIGSGEIHARLSKALAQVRAQLEGSASLELRLVALPPERWAGLSPAGGVLSVPELELLAKGEELACLRLAARDCEDVRAGRLVRSTFLGDFEVNQTGTTPVLNPVVEELLEGISAEVTCRFPPETGGAALLDCRIEGAQRVGAPRTLTYPPGGALELPALDHLALGGSLKLRPGEVGLLGALVQAGAEGAPRLLALTVTLRSLPEPNPAAEGEVTLRAYDLTRPLSHPGFSFPRPRWPGDAIGGEGVAFGPAQEEGESPTREALSEALLGRLAPTSGSWGDRIPRGIGVAQRAESHQRLAAHLAGLQPEPTALRYELVVLEAGSASPTTAALSPQECEALLSGRALKARYTLCGFPGQATELLARRELRALTDIERSSGGGLEATPTVQVDDPVVETLAGGISLRVQGHLSGDRVIAALDLDLRGIPSLRQAKTAWGTVELHSSAQRRVLRQASLASGGGVLLAREDGQLYLFRAWSRR